ncbi:hypothetical protein Tco_0625926 [Tanacetum coccineum]|uniref:Uncharacterized protein n=1 Tax=Tanacetum coccineum TaxID=301880 RepID=A0ABQ4WI72_9ASTR
MLRYGSVRKSVLLCPNPEFRLDYRSESDLTLSLLLLEVLPLPSRSIFDSLEMRCVSVFGLEYLVSPLPSPVIPLCLRLLDVYSGSRYFLHESGISVHSLLIDGFEEQILKRPVLHSHWWIMGMCVGMSNDCDSVTIHVLDFAPLRAHSESIPSSAGCRHVNIASASGARGVGPQSKSVLSIVVACRASPDSLSMVLSDLYRGLTIGCTAAVVCWEVLVAFLMVVRIRDYLICADPSHYVISWHHQIFIRNASSDSSSNTNCQSILHQIYRVLLRGAISQGRRSMTSVLLYTNVRGDHREASLKDDVIVRGLEGLMLRVVVEGAIYRELEIETGRVRAGRAAVGLHMRIRDLGSEVSIFTLRLSIRSMHYRLLWEFRE